MLSLLAVEAGDAAWGAFAKTAGVTARLKTPVGIAPLFPLGMPAWVNSVFSLLPHFSKGGLKAIMVHSSNYAPFRHNWGMNVLWFGNSPLGALQHALDLLPYSEIPTKIGFLRRLT
jgi:hypothetical protein